MKMRSHYSNQVTPDLDGEDLEIAGWVHEIRDLGKLKFLILRDREGLLQVVVKEGDCPDEVISLVDELSKESVIRVRGKVTENEKAPGNVELKPTEAEVLSKADSPLPLDVTQKVDADMDTRLNNRFMDLRKEDVSAIFKIRSKAINAGRRYLEEKDFIEITSPKIIASSSEGGTDLFPISYFDKEAFLAQSPQLYKQMMMATGLDNVFETTTYFRAEQHDTSRHLNEITAIDVETAFIEDEEDVLEVLENLAVSIIQKASECEKQLETLEKEVSVPELPLKRITYDEALDLLTERDVDLSWGQDLGTEAERELGKEIKEKYGVEMYFITKYPIQIKPFYTMIDEREEYSRAFDLGYKGVEISSGSQRIHDYDLLVERIKYHGLSPEDFEYYLKCFQYGMPPHGGFGLGIDRIMMQLLDLAIREVVLFPRDRQRLTP